MTTNHFYTILILFCFTLTISCSNFSWREPDIVEDKGVKLGQNKSLSKKQLGNPSVNITFVKKGHRVTIWEYNSEALDYQPQYTGEDDGGIYVPQSGVREYSKRKYRLIFVDNILYDIEDYVYQNTYQVSPYKTPADIAEILDEIRNQ